MNATELDLRDFPADVQEILDTLCALGRVRPGDMAGTYVR